MEINDKKSTYYRVYNTSNTQKLKDYPVQHQQNALSDMEKWYKRGQKMGGLLVLPTGGGKSFVATHFLCDHPLSDEYRILWLAHTNHLLEQALESFDKTMSRVDQYKMPIRVRVVSGAVEHFKPDHIEKEDNVLICTLQTATRAFKKRQSKFIEFIKAANAGAGLFIVFDEAHHAPAHTYRGLLKGIEDVCKPFGLLGLTATPISSDERKQGWLKRLFPDGIITQADARVLMAKGVLAQPRPEEVSTAVEPEFDEHDYKKWNTIYRDLPESIIHNLADNNLRNDLIASHYVKNKEKYGKTIMFADRWFQCEYLQTALEKLGVRAGAIYAHVEPRARGANMHDRHPAKNNAEIIKSFKDDELDVLINVQMLTEGIDVPDAQTVFLTRQTTSEILLKQMVGRALRGPLFGGTDKAYIVSFIDNWKHAINWSTYEQIMEGATDDEQPEHRLRVPLQLVSIDLVRRLARQMAGGHSANPAPYKTFLPVGWYKVEYEAVAVDSDIRDAAKEARMAETEYGITTHDNTETVRKLIMVYDHDKNGFKQFILRMYNLDMDDTLQDFEPSDLDMTETLDERLKDWQKEFFGDDDDRLGGTTADLLDLARHVAQQGGEPDFVRFEQRDDHDLDAIASDYNRQDLGPNATDNLLQREFDRHDRLWKIMYRDYDQFKSEYDACANRILRSKRNNVILESDKSTYTTPQSIPEMEPSAELKEMVKIRDQYHCLCCGSTNRTWLEVDHIIPKYFDMNHKLENLQSLCRTCNRQKSDKTIDFRKQQTGLSQVPDQFPSISMLDAEYARDMDKWKMYLQRVVNFFYCCSAVAKVEIAAKGERFRVWRIVLFPGNDPEWIRPHMGAITECIRQERIEAGVTAAPEKISVSAP